MNNLLKNTYLERRVMLSIQKMISGFRVPLEGTETEMFPVDPEPRDESSGGFDG